MKTVTLLASAMGCVCVTSAAAQTATSGTTASQPATVSWKVSADPVLTGDLDPTRGDTLFSGDESAYAVELKASKTWALVQGDASTKLGVTDDFDADNLNNSGWTTSVRLSTPKDWKGWTAFAKYEFAVVFKETFESFDYLDQTLKAGITYKATFPQTCETDGRCATVKVSPAISRLVSDKLGRDRTTPEVEGVLEIVAANRMKWTVTGKFEARRFDRSDPLDIERRRDNRGSLTVAVDIADLLSPKDDSILDALSLGVRWMTNDSNIADEDFNRWQVVPSIALGRKF